MIQTLFGSLKEAEEPKKRGFFERMREAVTRTRENLSQSLEEIVALYKEQTQLAPPLLARSTVHQPRAPGQQHHAQTASHQHKA